MKCFTYFTLLSSKTHFIFVVYYAQRKWEDSYDDQQNYYACIVKLDI